MKILSEFLGLFRATTIAVLYLAIFLALTGFCWAALSWPVLLVLWLLR